MPIIYRSLDDGNFYPKNAVDQPVDDSMYEVYEIPASFTLTADDVCKGDICNILMRAKIISKHEDY